MRNLILTTLILLLTGILILLWDSPPAVFRDKPVAANEKKLPVADGYMLETETTQHDKQGNTSYTLKTDEIRYFMRGRRFELDRPRILALDAENPTRPWHLDANSGEITNGGDVIVLSGDVYARQILNPVAKNELFSSQLIFYPEKNTLESDQKVTIKTPQAETSGHGLVANLKQERYQLLSKVRGTHRAPR